MLIGIPRSASGFQKQRPSQPSPAGTNRLCPRFPAVETAGYFYPSGVAGLQQSAAAIHFHGGLHFQCRPLRGSFFSFTFPRPYGLGYIVPRLWRSERK